MKKLYRKGTVHPSPPIISDHLAFLPATILTLTAALSAEDREVLAYLISCSNGGSSINFSSSGPSPRRQAQSSKPTTSGKDHPPQFNCDCFRCYTSYWVRWGSSPNRQLIHEIIDAFEDELLTQSKGGNSKTSNRKERRNNKRGNSNRSSSSNTGGCVHGSGTELKRSELSSVKDELNRSESESVPVGCNRDDQGEGHHDDQDESTTTSEKGSVRRFVSFIGERIWDVWG